jgi:hypothetical protein
MFKKVVNDVVAAGWTIFGLAIAWAVLPDGATRDVVGTTLLLLTIVWAATMPFRVKE